MDIDKVSAYGMTLAAVLLLAGAITKHSDWWSVWYALCAAWFAWRVVWAQEE